MWTALGYIIAMAAITAWYGTLKRLIRAQANAVESLRIAQQANDILKQWDAIANDWTKQSQELRVRLTDLTIKNVALYAEEQRQRARAVKAELELAEINDAEKREPIQ